MEDGKMLKLLFVFTSLFSLVGCINEANNIGDLKEYTAQIMAKPRGRVEPIPEFKPYESFSYSASAIRSPFRLAVVEEELSSGANGYNIRPDTDRPKEYLEQFNIEQLGMVGTLQKPDGELWALVKDGTGGVVRVKEGEYMGRNHGRVVTVLGGRINLIEIVPDGLGGWLERPRTLALDGTAGE
jgi:type IV pilus assembly protein PilP